MSNFAGMGVHTISESKGLTEFRNRKIVSIHLHTVSKLVIRFEGGEELHIDAITKHDTLEGIFPTFNINALVCFAIPVDPNT